MTTLKLLGAAAIMSAFIVSSASAQHVIDEPGMYAFVHPDDDLGLASARPPADAIAGAAKQPILRREGKNGLLRGARNDVERAATK